MRHFTIKVFTGEETNYTLNFYTTEKYEPVCAKWTTERCAICRWVEDWDYNKMIICNRCFSIEYSYLVHIG